MFITLIGADGHDDKFFDWPSQKMIEVSRDVIWIGNSDIGIAWLVYNSRLFRWQELNINGDLTGNEYVQIKVGV